MFERFTDPSRRVVVLAQEEARYLNHHHIGTEHILLGLLREKKSIAAQALTALGLSLETVRARVVELITGEKKPLSGHIPFTPRCKSALEFSLREALQLGHNYIGPEHILLGIVRQGEGLGAQILGTMCYGLTNVRNAVIVALSNPGSTPIPRQPQVSASGPTEGVWLGLFNAYAAMRSAITSGSSEAVDQALTGLSGAIQAAFMGHLTALRDWRVVVEGRNSWIMTLLRERGGPLPGSEDELVQMLERLAAEAEKEPAEPDDGPPDPDGSDEEPSDGDAAGG